MDEDFLMFNSYLNKKREDNVYAKFYDKWQKTSEILENGLPKFKKTTFVEIRVKDSHDVADRPADNEDYRRFPQEYQFYKLKQEKQANGTPLSMFAFLTPAQIETCELRGVFTVEDLSQLDEEKAKSINLLDEANLAKRFIDASKNNALIAQSQNEIKRLHAEIDRLKEKIKVLEEAQQ